jgi:hypothetical protein
MRVLDICNLDQRKLNHHEEVYSQESVPEAPYREQEPGNAGDAAAFASQPAGSAAAAVDDRTSSTVDRATSASTPASRIVRTERERALDSTLEGALRSRRALIGQAISHANQRTAEITVRPYVLFAFADPAGAREHLRAATTCDAGNEGGFLALSSESLT